MARGELPHAVVRGVLPNVTGPGIPMLEWRLHGLHQRSEFHGRRGAVQPVRVTAVVRHADGGRIGSARHRPPSLAAGS
jgi:hypothetical protein